MTASPDVGTVERDIADAGRYLERILDAYRWLSPSAYLPSRRSNDIGSLDPATLATAGPAPYLAGQLGHAAEALRRAVRQLQIADTALDRAQDAIDSRPPVADENWRDHPELSAADRRRVHRARERRVARMESHATPWAREEVTG